ncbi:hypothetical protein KCM76_04015 [Zooshikella marina]|uniref:SGNH/GDSL hydrolase family protein n=1 Tax=Zooshikella ganghwensis TaxID=202772 RepID=UPI001BAEBB60|nr:SGNH/GDSL hydrolase family protein [Zooshikella ganghwensis]MBU2705132.1 hypothetical protein [Zooshikella ganghwensis]
MQLLLETKKRVISVLLFFALFILVPTISKAENYQHLVVFGDSLSDNGIDDGNGFLRNSNGKVWPEYLAGLMAVKTLDVRAWSGATSGRGNYNTNASDWSGLLWQVKNYRPTTPLNKTLAIVQIGTNDLHDPDKKITPEQVSANVENALKQLSAKGIKNIIVWNLNTTVVSPGYTDKQYEWYEYYKDKKDTATEQYIKFNHLIKNTVNQLNSHQQSTNILLFDANVALTEIAKKFENTTTPWRDTKYYPKENGWFWFDHWHYMTETHKYIADYLFQLI